MRGLESIFHGPISTEALEKSFQELKEKLDKRLDHASMEWDWNMSQKMMELKIYSVNFLDGYTMERIESDGEKKVRELIQQLGPRMDMQTAARFLLAIPVSYVLKRKVV